MTMTRDNPVPGMTAYGAMASAALCPLQCSRLVSVTPYTRQPRTERARAGQEAFPIPRNVDFIPRP
jgi:precorrin-2 methylase